MVGVLHVLHPFACKLEGCQSASDKGHRETVGNLSEKCIQPQRFSVVSYHIVDDISTGSCLS